ncbi:OmpA family protein [Thiovibrio frasassiensis]|uniref:OmpA family protein n=1 Tax=Thiovibrio frasassiensis TaxID=2984131 RepID=A0A9X4RL43_9BACT|nr:OmpA family protein [Thiovibrio frasassiensis]MDG4474683.1 OmpA family protein [Thiovibrio frasassiensis]
MSIGNENKQTRPAARQNTPFSLLLLCGLTLSCLLPPPASAADCKGLAAKIQQERSPIARRDLLKDAIKQCPKDPEINFMQGYNLERLRDYKEALPYYVTASTLDPKQAKAFFGMGDIYMVTDNAQNAVTSYEKGLGLDPGNKRAAKSLESARIKLKAQRGESVSSEEAATVLFAEKSKDREISPIEATILRLLILFPNKSAELPEEGGDQLSIVGTRAFTSRELKGATFEVVGNTDDSGDAAVNMALSRKRAEAVRNYLIKSCNIEAKKLQVVALGQTHPIVPNTTEQNRKINNRVEFRRLK